jgi:Domain of unknown function (DUF4177)
MQQWEYRTETIKLTIKGFSTEITNTVEIDRILNELGANGWEMISFDDHLSSLEVLAVFKRPRV